MPGFVREDSQNEMDEVLEELLKDREMEEEWVRLSWELPDLSGDIDKEYKWRAGQIVGLEVKWLNKKYVKDEYQGASKECSLQEAKTPHSEEEEHTTSSCLCRNYCPHLQS